MIRIFLYGLIFGGLFCSAALGAEDQPELKQAMTSPHIAIPALEIEADIGSFPLARNTWNISPWARGIGHLEGTGWFGMRGNVVLAGHAEMPGRQPGVFADLETLSPGDMILVRANGESYQYIVREISNVSMHDVSVVAPSHYQSLTLITCDAASFDPNHQLYERRVVVTAVRAEWRYSPRY